MDDYMKVYDTLETVVVYEYDYRYGGIGDCIKFFMYLLQFCIDYKYQIKYRSNHSVLEQFLRLKYDKLYIPTLTSLKKGVYSVQPSLFYPSFHNDWLRMKIEDVFCFTDEIKQNALQLLSFTTPYTSIHLRLGDKYLETDLNVIYCKEDVRHFSEEKLIAYIEQNRDTPLVFFCDNHAYKEKMKHKYAYLNLTKGEIAHTGLSTTTYKQTMDAVTEFYILTESENIVAVSSSGFSEISSKFKGVPLIRLYI